MKIITTKNLTKIYTSGKKGNAGIKNICLEFEDRGFYAIYGKSGSGKTTLLNALGGLDRFDSGSLIIDGKEFSHSADDKFRAENIGYIFQNYCLDPDMNVYDNVAAGLKTAGINDPEIIFERTMTALADVGMEKYYRRSVTALSGGQQQRVAAARALVKDCKILLADEPTGNLDEYNTLNMLRILKEISKTRLVIVVTHETDIIEKYADKVIEISDGEASPCRDGGGAEAAAGIFDRVFLGDLEKKTQSIPGTEINFYGENAPAKLDIISVNGKFYLRCSEKVVPTEESEKIFVDSSGEEYKKSVEREETSLSLKSANFEKLNPQKRTTGRLFNFRESFKKPVRNKKAKRKLFMLRAVVSVLLCAVVGLIFGFVNSVQRYESLTPRGADAYYVNYASVRDWKILDDFAKEHADLFACAYAKSDGAGLFTEIDISSSNFQSASGETFSRSLWGIFTYDEMGEKTLSRGKIKKDGDFVLLSSGLVKKALNYFEVVDSGSSGIPLPEREEDFIGLSVVINKNGAEKNLSVTGIVNDAEENIYTSSAVRQEAAISNFDLTFEITDYYDGQALDDYRIITEMYESGEYLLNLFGENIKLTVEKSENKDSYGTVVLNQKTYDAVSKYFVGASGYGDACYCFAPADAASAEKAGGLLAKLKDETGGEFKLVSQKRIAEMRNENHREDLTVAIVSIIITAVAAPILMIFIMFSDFSSRVKNVGIYRAVGVSKKNIVFRVFVENLRKVVIPAVFAQLVFSLLVMQDIAIHHAYSVSLITAAASAAALCFAGIVPALRLLRKTPIQILSKYDV